MVTHDWLVSKESLGPWDCWKRSKEFQSNKSTLFLVIKIMLYIYGKKDPTSHHPTKIKSRSLNACFLSSRSLFWVGFHSKHNPRTQGNSYSRTWYIHISIFPASGFVYVSDYISPYKKPWYLLPEPFRKSIEVLGNLSQRQPPIGFIIISERQ